MRMQTRDWNVSQGKQRMRPASDVPSSRPSRKRLSRSERVMRRLGLMETGPTAPGRAEDAIGFEIRHAGMVVQRADLLVAGLTGNAVAQDQGVSGPGPPLLWLVGSAEENHR